jgi:RecA/RadA recombinase
MSEAIPRRKRGDASADARVTTTDPVWGKILSKAAKQVGDKTRFTRRAASAMLLGIPSPSLALSYGLGSNVIPLSRVLQLAGRPGAFKTALMIDFFRMILECCETGVASGVPLIPESILYNENENKIAPDYIWSILEHRKQYEDVFRIEETLFMDDWMANMTRKCKEWDALFDPSSGGPGWCVPLALSVDSLMGTAPKEQFEKIMKAGSPDRSFPLSANLLTIFSQMLPGMLGRRPILFIATNHLKDGVTATGVPEERVPGGRAFQHAESMEFRLSRVSDIKHDKLPGAVVKIKFHKNCLGDSRRSIEVPIRWTFDLDDEGEKRQWTMWDWPKASIDLLVTIEAKRPDLHAKVKQILDLNVSQGRVWSTALGVPKTDRVSVHEAGCILEESPAVLDALLPVLGIRQGRFFTPGMDFAVERLREDVTADSLAYRVFRRPAANDLTRLVSSQVVADGERHDGFEIDTTDSGD